MMKAYPEYKESGVKWLGDIPSDWTVKRLKFLCELQTGDKDTANAKTGAEYDFFVRAQKIEKIDSYSHHCEAVLTAGDGVGVGKVFHYTNGKFSFHQRVYMMNNFKEVLGRYFYYYLSTLFSRVALDGGAKSTVDSLRMPTFTNFYFSYPPLVQQTVIVNYLDVETARIDGLITEKQNFITLLKEKRQALISHYVTKGLDPNVKMKDSGVEWIGEVPEHWGIKQIKHLGRLNPNKSGLDSELLKGICSFIPMTKLKTDSLLLDEIKPVAEVFEGYNYFEDEDVLFAKVTPCFENKNMCIAKNLVNGVGFGSSEINVFRVNKETDNRYFYYLIQEEHFMQFAKSNMTGAGGLKRVPSEVILDYKIAIPCAAEQSKIADYLEEKFKKLNELSIETNKSIELLKEHRTALISAAVTGKIDVRDILNNQGIESCQV